MQMINMQKSLTTKCNKELDWWISNHIIIFHNANTNNVCVCSTSLSYRRTQVSVNAAKYIHPYRLLNKCQVVNPRANCKDCLQRP